MDFGSSPGSDEVAGTLEFLGGIPSGTVNVYNGLTGTIDLNGGDVSGFLLLSGGGDGSIVNGGTVSGLVGLGSAGYPFTGTADFDAVAGSGTVSSDYFGSGDDLPGTLDISGNVSGTIDITGELSGDLDIGGTFTGELCAENLDGGKPLPPNVSIYAVGSGASVCETEASVCGTIASAPAAEPSGVTKNRFISFVPGNSGNEVAIAVNMGSLHHPTMPANPPNLTMHEEEIRFVNAIRDGGGNPVYTCPDSGGFGTSFKCAKLGCSPEYRDWAYEIGGGSVVLHVTGEGIAPSSVYNVHMIHDDCKTDGENWAEFSTGILAETALWGDVDDTATVTALDVSKVVDKAADVLNALPEYRTMLQHDIPLPYTLPVNALDLAHAVNANNGKPYPFAGPSSCP
jgi:hypothetical protein